MRDIVLVTVDSLRADHVGWHGYDRDTTPHLDDLADRSRRFTRAFSHACSTRPSFPSILTSSYALMYGGFERLSSDRTTLAEALSGGGYRTAGFHSNLYLSADFGYDRGFDTFYDSRTDPSLTAEIRNTVKRHLDSDGLVYRALQRAFNATEKQAGIEIGSPYVDAADLTDLALDWVRTVDGDGPRFLWVHYMDVHHPYVPPADHQRRFRDEAVSDREAVQLRRKMLESPGDLSDDERRTLVDLYDAEISYVDSEVDRFLEGVRSAWGGDPVVAFTSDHGEAFGEHGRYSHSATFYDELLHVPLLVSGGETTTADAAIGASGEFDGLVGLLDLAPTLVDAAGLDEPDAFWGSSLLDTDDWSRTAVVAEWAATDEGSDDRRFAVRTGEWKYVRLEDGSERLFDLDSDPSEQGNVADERPEVVERFRSRLADHEELLSSTNRKLGSVTMDEEVSERLRLLGYQE